MTWNHGRKRHFSSADCADRRRHERDVVTLPETTIETGEAVAVAMRSARAADVGPPHDVRAVGGELDHDSHQPSAGRLLVIESSEDGSSNSSTVPSGSRCRPNGNGPIIVAAHAVAPRQRGHDGVGERPAVAADQCASDNVILAGDFNATVDHMSGPRRGTAAPWGPMRGRRIRDGQRRRRHMAHEHPALAGAPSTMSWRRRTGRRRARSCSTPSTAQGSDHRPLVVQLEPAT